MDFLPTVPSERSVGQQMDFFSSFSFSFSSFSFFQPLTWRRRRRRRRRRRNTSYSYYCTVYCTVLYCTVLYCTVLYCTVLYCTVLYCTVLYCTVLYCTVQYRTIFFNPTPQKKSTHLNIKIKVKKLNKNHPPPKIITPPPKKCPKYRGVKLYCRPWVLRCRCTLVLSSLFMWQSMKCIVDGRG